MHLGLKILLVENTFNPWPWKMYIHEIPLSLLVILVNIQKVVLLSYEM